MHVAYVSMDIGVPVFGKKGCSIHVQEMIRALIKLGASVDLFTTNVGGLAPSDLKSVRLHHFPIDSEVDASNRELQSLSRNQHLREISAQLDPFDLVYERYSLWSYQGMEFARSRGVPGVLEVNAPLIEEQVAHRGLIHRKHAETVASRVFGAAETLVAVSVEVARYLEHFSAAQGRIHVIPNGVNAHRFWPRPISAEAGQTPFTVGFVGTLKPWHGLPVLVDAFELLHRRDSNTRLLIVGDGSGRGKLQEDLKRRGLTDAAHLTGAVDASRVPALLTSMDVGVAPYDDAEHFYFSPLKVFEYMAAGLPVVASRIGQLADLISNDENGILCAPGDAVSVATALARLQDDRSLGVRLGRAARACVMRDHTWDATLQRILDAVGFDPAGRLSRREMAA